MLIYTKDCNLTRSVIDVVMYLRKSLSLPLEGKSIILGEFTIEHIRNRAYRVSLTKYKALVR